MEMERAAWERAARTVDALADGLGDPPRLDLPADRYGRALGGVPAASDAAARDLHAAAVADLRALATRIRRHARAAVDADEAGARAIEAVR